MSSTFYVASLYDSLQYFNSTNKLITEARQTRDRFYTNAGGLFGANVILSAVSKIQKMLFEMLGVHKVIGSCHGHTVSTLINMALSETPQCLQLHLFQNNYMKDNPLISRTALSPMPVRSVVKSNLTSR